MNTELKEEILSLVENAKIVYVSSIDAAGFPETKAMMNLKRDGMKTHYFSTNTSSKRVQQFRDNPNACIYFSDNDNFMGLMLVGKVQVCTDRAHKELLWFPGAEMYYPKGIDDEDYCVYEFSADWGNYYHGLRNTTFPIGELE